MDLPDRQSAFLWGARQTGKSSYLKAHFQSSVYYDLLATHEVARLTKEPHLLREELIQLDQKSRKEPITIENAQAIVVSQDKRARQLKVDKNITIQILPWKTFLKRLWNEELC